jgi:sugar (pentulose or hexulose) kinase
MSMKKDIQRAIESGKTTIGIELGSTRIKAVLLDEDKGPIASGSYDWENRIENDIWTYNLESVWTGLQDCIAKLRETYFSKFLKPLDKVDSVGISAMMHGYLPFDKKGNLLVPFRTWRNTMTEPAATQLSQLLQFNIPQRWSIAHLYQAILNQEPHVKEIAFMTTLAGYVHWKLTDNKVLGIGDASGMFPIDSFMMGYDEGRIKKFDQLVGTYAFPWKVKELLPEVLIAGANGGVLTEAGAKLLDPSGQLKAGIPFCPPEGDAGTGMVATNCVAERTCNVSAGTSVFAMVVLEKPLSMLHPEIDMVTTPTGKPVAMVHSNNCTSDLNTWVGLFEEFTQTLGVSIGPDRLFELLYTKAMEGEADCGGLLSFNYVSGEHITHLAEGRPLFIRTPNSNFNLANFMRTHLYSAIGALKIGVDILFDEEHVKIDKVLGHGGFFKTKDVGQKVMAAAMNSPVSVMTTAGEGGAWGIALLAAYMVGKKQNEKLEDYLSKRIFANEEQSTIFPEASEVAGFSTFMKRYKQGLVIESTAVENC